MGFQISLLLLLSVSALSLSDAFVVGGRRSAVTLSSAWTKSTNVLFSQRTTALASEEANAEGATTSPSGNSNENEPNTYVRCGKCQTIYPITEDDLGKGRGRRLECSVCTHSWFQSKDRLMYMKEGFNMVPLPEEDLERINVNLKEGKPAGFMGDVKIYVGNIAFECHEDDILAEFSRIGPVGDVSLVRDEEGRIRGFGFVTMRSKEDGQKAIDALDGMPVRGRKIAVRESNN
jgi:predicted Zn finger-like uncharacterized protein